MDATSATFEQSAFQIVARADSHRTSALAVVAHPIVKEANAAHIAGSSRILVDHSTSRAAGRKTTHRCKIRSRRHPHLRLRRQRNGSRGPRAKDKNNNTGNNKNNSATHGPTHSHHQRLMNGRHWHL